MRTLLCFLLFAARTLVDADVHLLDSQIETECVHNCPLQNRTDGIHYDYTCNYDCIIDQCEKGCKLWRRAVNTTCQKACNGRMERLTPKQMHCVMGCNDALTKYFSMLKTRLGIPPAPALVADSLGATSLKLEWTFPIVRALGLNCHVQWKYEELPASWQYCRNITWNPQMTTVFIQNLQPYTKYRFRIALMMGVYGEAVTSEPSVVISTLPWGVPASPPTIVRAAAVDCTRISVTWEAGPFPHGPLLSYTLQITDNHPQLHTEIKDIPPENNVYMFRNLRPSRNYTIEISMRNGAGLGPGATVLVSTPPEPQVKDSQQPAWIIGTEDNVFLQKNNMLTEPIQLYSSRTIKGVGVHIRKELLFVSESSGYLKSVNISGERPHDTKSILHPSQINFRPLELSIDWLNDQLYILGEVKFQQYPKWQITRCNLDGSELTVAYAGLSQKPHTLEIDPYNGYLFWMIQGNSKGLYRLNVSEISNGIKHEVKPEHILKKENLGAFTVDYAKFRLYVADQDKKTIHKVSLDGKEVEDIRSKNVIKSRLEDVISLACTNDTFFWTDGRRVFLEEYHKPSRSYFHNAFLESSFRKYIKIIFNLPSSQPIPVPVNPPTNLQGIFGANIAKLTWKAPYLLDGQGKGAWQNWSYEVLLREKSSSDFKSNSNINTTTTTIKKLKANTEYVIKVAAYTSFGNGPSSTEFKGITLRSTEQPMILWSAAEGLLKTDAVGENLETLIHKHRLKNYHFTDVAWYKDQIYLVSNQSQVYRFNLDSHKYHKLLENDSVGSIAVDWLGKKLYWSNPQQQLIIRGNLDGSHQETLPILSIAKELNIDSVKAFLYWATVRTVECARLNGADKIKYDELKLFSTKQVMGLTLDMDHKYVYWIVRGSDGSNLLRSRMAGYTTETKIAVEKLPNPKKVNMQGPLCYFHNHFLWLQDTQSAAISDLEGKNIASIADKSMTDLALAYVVDPSQHKTPDVNGSSNVINVIPETVDHSSIKVSGTSSSFNITWRPIQNVNFGTVFYEVQIETQSHNNLTVTSILPSVKYWKDITPFTELHVSVRAFTYWGNSLQTRAKVYSPPSTPSVPNNPRAYVTHDVFRETYSITFRWDEPTYPNGVINGYKVHCWYQDDTSTLDVCNDTIVQEHEFVLNNIGTDQTEIFFFQVQASTEIGNGELSKAVQVDPRTESPIPTLLIASADSIFIHDIDTDKNHSVMNGINTPIEMCYLDRENKVFWINKKRELHLYHVPKDTKSKLLDISGDSKSLTIDWLERSLYYVEQLSTGGSNIYKLNLNHLDKGVLRNDKILQTISKISKIEVSPFTQKLYWTETTDDLGYNLIQSDNDGTNVQEFFSDQSRTRREAEDEGDIASICNCSSDMSIEKTFTIDHSETHAIPLVIFIDRDTRNVMSADIDGCICKVIAKNSLLSDSYPLDRLKSDFGTLYWTSPSQDLLYALKKNQPELLKKEVKVHDITIFGTHIQPYPPKECLSPKQDNFRVSLKKKTANSLVLEMPRLQFDAVCENVSVAATEYRVYYKEYDVFNDVCDENCSQKISFDEELELDQLQPFTKYIVSVSMSNYYTEETEIIIGSPVLFQTAPGAPSKPRNVSAIILNPNVAEVTWLPPEKLNGDVVYYEIHWQTDVTISGVRQKGEQPVVEQEFYNKSSDYLRALLHKLSPNETYTIWIRAYCETNETSSDSDRIQIRTYPEPNSFALINKTAYTLRLEWMISEHIDTYEIQYTPITSKSWLSVETKLKDEESDVVEINVGNLKPKTQYKFRLALLYATNTDVYIWPTDSRFIYETLGDRPSPPGIPIIQYAKPDTFKVWWEAAKENGAPIELYILECLQLPNYRTKRSTVQNRTAWFYTAPSVEEVEREWKQVYNGTDTSWIIKDLDKNYKYAFRASALNAYGWSDPSPESTEIDFNETAKMAESQTPNIVIGIAVPLSLGLFATICLLYQVKTGKCSKKKKMQEVVILPRGPDVELATLRELPRRGIHSINMFYVAAQPTAAEISMLPHIRREKITLTKFLGSGAFGEVFEGIATDIQEVAETKVAVKTLRKGASEQEKCEFLQEAQLMSHFKHEHILQLLGVCLDNDPNFIIMELMEGGDLLTYLRASRALMSKSDGTRLQDRTTLSLTLNDLLKMCVDVSKGCRYLEEMHFVHRDLACRNCLVSSNDPDTRIVKIGDFGLARDIYKNDYYRKEGEGLLPVRWMAPESLVDGVFTSQSDVWAFGVLLWEIMTLGQQPYPARNNLEVLHYVRGGGRLKRPFDCPGALYALMLKCWEFDPDRRPTFKYCLEILEQLHLQILKASRGEAQEGQYISTVPDHCDGFSNAVYFQDENHNGSGISWRSDQEDDSLKEKTPFLSADQKSTPKEQADQDQPKYIEIVSDQNDRGAASYWDGYEIPNDVLKDEAPSSTLSSNSSVTKRGSGSDKKNNTKDNKKIVNSPSAHVYNDQTVKINNER